VLLLVAAAAVSPSRRSSAAVTFVVPAYAGAYAAPGGVAPLYPAGGDADASGTRYVVDSGGDRVVRFAPDGTMTQILKTGLDKPRALALDPDPTKLWVADTRDNQVLQISVTGTILRTFGGTGSLKAPFGIAADASGVYVADTYDYRVVKLRASDGARLWAQTSCAGQTISRPRGVTVGSDGDVYVADTDHGRIVVLDPATGACRRAFGSPGSGDGQFAGPRDLVSDGAGGLWVAEAKSARIQHVTNTGVFISKTGGYGSGPGKFRAPACVFMDGGAVDVCDTYEFVVQRFSVSSSGSASYLGSLGGVRPSLGGFNQPFGVAFNAAGDLFVTDMFNQRAQERTAGGTWFQWGGFGGRAGAMQFPRGIVVAGDGTIVLTNSENDRIDLFAPDLSLTRSIRPSGTSFGWPHQTALAADGTYWVADTNKNRVLHLSPSGSVLGSFTGGGQIKTPSGIALDAAGNVYVANRGSNTVQKYTPGGSLVATLATPGSGATNVRTPWNLTIVSGTGGQVLLVADGGNGRILALSLGGAPLGSFGSKGSGPGQLLDPRSVAVNPVDGTFAVADMGNNRISLWR
jgi:DNA-binding beta-propeller fold protein YncE